MSYRVTIVSAYYGNQEMTEDFLKNLVTKISKEDRIIITSAGNMRFVDFEHPQVTHLILPINVSFANSMNHGIKEALKVDTEFICILGNDGFPLSPDWLDKLIETTLKEGSCITCPVPTRPDISVYNKHIVKKLNDHVTQYKMFPAICWLLPTDIVQKTGLFDEQFVGGCYEDDDYVLRIRQRGGIIVVDHRVHIDHLLSQTFGKLPNSGAIMAANGDKLIKKWSTK